MKQHITKTELIIELHHFTEIIFHTEPPFAYVVYNYILSNIKRLVKELIKILYFCFL